MYREGNFKIGNFMKVFLLIIIFLFSLPASTVELKPLSNVLEKRNLEDPTTMLYLLQRCSGLYATGWDHIIDQNPEAAEKLLYSSKKFIVHATKFFKGAENFTQNELLKEMHAASEKFQKFYTDLFTENWYENGSYFEGTWIEEDLEMCGIMNSSLADF